MTIVKGLADFSATVASVVAAASASGPDGAISVNASQPVVMIRSAAVLLVLAVMMAEIEVGAALVADLVVVEASVVTEEDADLVMSGKLPVMASVPTATLAAQAMDSSHTKASLVGVEASAVAFKTKALTIKVDGLPGSLESAVGRMPILKQLPPRRHSQKLAPCQAKHPVGRA